MADSDGILRTYPDAPTETRRDGTPGARTARTGTDPSRERTRRTQEHVNADLSYNHIERLVLECGHTANRVEPDYGYDQLITFFDSAGYQENGSVFVQVKSIATLPRGSDTYSHPLEIRHVNTWRDQPYPVLLVLYDAAARRAYWRHMNPFLAERDQSSVRTGQRTIKVPFDLGRVVDHEAVRGWADLKRSAHQRMLRAARNRARKDEDADD